MIYKEISCYSIIADIYRDFGIAQSGWTDDAIEWIGRSLEIIGHTCRLKTKISKVNINNYKGKIPCESDSIESITYGGKRLTETKYSGSLTDLLSGAYYYLTPAYVNVGFECGQICVEHQVIPTDENGYPLVPDAPMHKEAIAMFIMMRMLGRGMKHPVFTFPMAEERWINLYPQATNEGNWPNIGSMELFRKRWTSIIVDKRFIADGMFEDKGIRSSDDSTFTLLPSENVRTIIHVDDSSTSEDIIGGGNP
jgi:hypothetical protein